MNTEKKNSKLAPQAMEDDALNNVSGGSGGSTRRIQCQFCADMGNTTYVEVPIDNYPHLVECPRCHMYIAFG